MPDLDRLSDPDNGPQSWWEASYDEAMARAKRDHERAQPGGGGGSSNSSRCVVVLLLMFAAAAGLADAIWSVLA